MDQPGPTGDGNQLLIPNGNSRLGGNLFKSCPIPGFGLRRGMNDNADQVLSAGSFQGIAMTWLLVFPWFMFIISEASKNGTATIHIVPMRRL